jgi:hypothetical protein
MTLLPMATLAVVDPHVPPQDVLRVRLRPETAVSGPKPTQKHHRKWLCDGKREGRLNNLGGPGPRL